ncbi:hypothetical protein Leryth_005886 [Lithospermum erythrorhizon]|nr:hypothetical protein Leryth_005886 [Lithospermum erythrorhizon]
MWGNSGLSNQCHCHSTMTIRVHKLPISGHFLIWDNNYNVFVLGFHLVNYKSLGSHPHPSGDRIVVRCHAKTVGPYVQRLQ